jgi:large subunit ribosomal protein L5
MTTKNVRDKDNPKENPMRKIRIEKITLNIGCGTEKNPKNAAKLLEIITEQKPVITKTHKRTTFGMAKNKEIGARVTIRKGCEELLKRLLQAVGNKLKESSFDEYGNFAFGIPEYILIPGMSYDPYMEMFGLDVCVTLERPGYRVKKKRLSKKLGKNHVITKQEAIEWVKKNFNVEIVSDIEK